jgi:hypothetical protein
VNIRGEVHAYLAPEDYRRLRLEALARGVSLSRCAGDCLAEYFALRREMATALEAEAPEQLRTLAPSRVIHVLLAQTEQRLVATLERYGEDLTAVRAEVAAVLAMLDRSAFTFLCCTPEVPPAAQARGVYEWRATVCGLASCGDAHAHRLRPVRALAAARLGARRPAGVNEAADWRHHRESRGWRPARPDRS